MNSESGLLVDLLAEQVPKSLTNERKGIGGLQVVIRKRL